jgi:transketolase
MDLRKSFWNSILEIAKKDKKVIVMTGDLGFSFVEKFAMELPKQFLNVGIAEQNMIGIAEGMALSGLRPYCYSGAVFLTHRPLEQIRNACYNNLDIKLIGTGASQFLGFSHNFSEKENELEILNKFPNIKCHRPKSEKQLEKLLKKEGKGKGPRYIRL